MTPEQTPSAEAAVLVALARLEGKLDTALAQHGTRLDEAVRSTVDHEKRLRELEAQPVVSPRQLWSVVSSVVLVVAAASPILTRFFSS